jgi:hypothetical protein
MRGVKNGIVAGGEGVTTGAAGFDSCSFEGWTPPKIN